MHSYAYYLLMEGSTWEGILMDVYQHMDRCTVQEMMRCLAQPLPNSVAVRENFHLSHFSSKHDEGGNYLLYVLHSLIFLSSISYQGGSFLLAHYSLLYLWSIAAIMMAILLVDCGGKPQDFRCTPLEPSYVFMISYHRMNVVEKKWLKGNLLYYILR